jgi:hypothetical protein
MSDKVGADALFNLYHRVELAEIILNWCSGKNNPSRSLQHLEHG